MPAPTAYVTSSSAARAGFSDVAISVRMEPSTGPAHGVQSTPSAIPTTRPPALPDPARETPPSAKASRPLNLAITHSYGRGHSSRTPKLPSRMTETFRKVSCDKPSTVENEPNRIANPENVRMKPATRKSGRRRSCWPMEAPSKTGSSGRMQGAAAVSRPAANAKAISIMSNSPRGRPPSLHQRQERLALLDDVGGKLAAGDAAEVPGRMDCSGRNEEHVACLQFHRRLVLELIFERAFQDINDFLAGMGVLAERHAGGEVDADLDGLASGRAEVVPLQVGSRDPVLLRLRAKRRENGAGD